MTGRGRPRPRPLMLCSSCGGTPPARRARLLERHRLAGATPRALGGARSQRLGQDEPRAHRLALPAPVGGEVERPRRALGPHRRAHAAHDGSGWPARRWPRSCARALARHRRRDDGQARRPRTVVAPLRRWTTGSGPHHSWLGSAWATSPTARSARCPRASSSGCSWPARSWPIPGLVLLDEPTAGLDLAGREGLVRALAALATDASVAADRARHPPRRRDPARVHPPAVAA